MNHSYSFSANIEGNPQHDHNLGFWKQEGSIDFRKGVIKEELAREQHPTGLQLYSNFVRGLEDGVFNFHMEMLPPLIRT